MRKVGRRLISGSISLSISISISIPISISNFFQFQFSTFQENPYIWESSHVSIPTSIKHPHTLSFLNQMSDKTNNERILSDKAVTDKEKVNFTEGEVEEYKFYPDNPKNHRHKYRWANKEASRYYDPCEESRQASINCVLRNQKDKSVCQEFFDAYRECSKDFFAKKRQDRREGKKGWGIW